MFKVVMAIYRTLLKLRYKTEFKGIELFEKEGAKMVLPNHQSMTDSQLIVSKIFKYAPIRPVAGERFVNSPLLKGVFKQLKTVSVSDLSKGSRDTAVLNTIFNEVITALKTGDSVILFPAGHLMGQGYERIFNKKSAWFISKNLPENTRIIGVRVSGLWGSMWSKAWSGDSPDFVRTYLKSIFFILANFIFLVPRRKLTIEFEDITEEAVEKANGDSVSFNNYLEAFYNKNGHEQVNFLKHYFYAPKLKRALPARIMGSVDEVESIGDSHEANIPKQVIENVTSILAKELEIRISSITLKSNLSLDLNLDSIALITILGEIEAIYGKVPEAPIELFKTVADLCLYAQGKLVEEEELKPSTIQDHIYKFRDIRVNREMTVPEAFLHWFSQEKSDTFVYDKVMGSTTRKAFMLKAFVVSKIIRKEIKDDKVGIMLPAMQATALLVIATYLAEKIPVMINWTGGKKIVDHCLDVVDLNVILTAGKFYDRVEDLLSERAKQKCMFFEKKVAEAGIGTKLAGIYSSKFHPKYNAKPDDVAVILFTSGSESLPKAVPLTHRNLMFNMWGAMERIKLQSDKILVGFLPPFHSFGFTILTILPLVTATKVIYSPDPTDNREILKLIKHTKANTILATPTFLKMILNIANKEDLKHVQLAVTGAESLHSSVIQEFYNKADKNAVIVEGYGITECAPVITLNTLYKQKEKSVGPFLEGIDYLITDINTYEPQGNNVEGMIMVRGNNIFAGYSDKKLESPFVNINGEDYYKTGDLGYVDDDGFLFITGRLKRFIKIAGEMISLGAIEGTLLNKYGLPDEVALAIDGDDTVIPPEISLYSTQEINLTEANAYLKSEGFSNLIKVNKVHKIESVPLLGTGKTDYKQLKHLI